ASEIPPGIELLPLTVPTEQRQACAGTVRRTRARWVEPRPRSPPSQQQRPGDLPAHRVLPCARAPGPRSNPHAVRQGGDRGLLPPDRRLSGTTTRYGG